MWDQDYCLNPGEDDFFQRYFWGEDICVDDLEKNEEDQTTEPAGRPSWLVRVEYSNHTVQDISGYNDYLLERPEELYFSLLEYFELKKEEFGFVSR